MTLSEERCKPRNCPGHRAQVGGHGDPPHRAGEDCGFHIGPVHKCAQPDAATHGVRDHEPGARQVFSLGKADHRRPVFLKVRELRHVADHRVRADAVCHALTAPVDCQNVKATGNQIISGVSVFFDIFGATGQQEHSAFARNSLRMTNAKAHPVRGAQPIRVGLWPLRQIRPVRGGVGHQASDAASFIAMPISPSIVRRPDMKADVGSSEPSKISR